MKTSHRWFRVYIETIYDPKLLRLPVAGRWLWIVLLALAKQSPDEGKLLVAEDVPMTATEMGRTAGLTKAQTERLLVLMEQQGMMAVEGQTWSVKHWGERQFVSDDGAQRMQRHRQRHSDGEGDVSAPSRVTPPETETETETKQNRVPPISPSRGKRKRRNSSKGDRSVPLSGEHYEKVRH